MNISPFLYRGGGAAPPFASIRMIPQAAAAVNKQWFAKNNLYTLLKTRPAPLQKRCYFSIIRSVVQKKIMENG